ncbi:MAG TPA: T9SS type A sorting domain-containing protein [Flavilitoribacter sp.]|nr:T9SS type A sorting domain-containing protein [Flavilitoribacter sp.]
MNARLLFPVFLALPFTATPQCNTVVSSSNGYQVSITLNPRAIAAPSTCPNGYNFNAVIDYDVKFTGNNQPGSLYTLQARLHCGDFNLFFDLPNTGGTGTLTTTANPYSYGTDCATATPASLGCLSTTIEIQGPGIPPQFIPCAVTVLPVELTFFKAKQQGGAVELTWQTAAEINNDFFEVQRSGDGDRWETVARVNGAGNSTQSLNYALTDRFPLSGQSYYRLRQVDFNGEFRFSEVAAIAAPSGGESPLAVYPNPVSDLLTIEGPSEQLEDIAILDLLGRRVNGVAIVREAATRCSADLSGLPSGVYLLRTADGVQKIYRK